MRRGPRQEPYDSVLIVCEGAKSEPAYFRGLRITYGLSNANIHVMSAPGNDPMSIVTFAEDEMAKSSEYDRVFCVFDRNGHANYDAALTRIIASPNGQSGKLQAITSWPCFEIWLLLHFRYSTAPFNRTANKSSCDRAIEELLRHFPGYTKGRQTIFEDLVNQMPNAVTNAKQLHAHNLKSESSNPSTKMHVIVEYLIGLKPN